MEEMSKCITNIINIYKPVNRIQNYMKQNWAKLNMEIRE